MKCRLFSAAVAAVGLFALINPVLANPQRPSPAAAQVKVEQVQTEPNAVQRLDWGTEGYADGPTFNLNLRNLAPSPDPQSGNFAPPGSVILKPNAFYGQLQTGTFGNNNPGDQWSAFGSPGPLVTGIYGLRYNWEQDFATFSLTNVNATRKDATIGFGSGLDTQLNFNFVNTALVPTTVASFFPAFGLQVRGATREGIETGTTQAPGVFSFFLGPSPLPGVSTTGYIGLINRRINDVSVGSGRVLARTDVLTLERDATFGGLQINYPIAAGTPYVTCFGITSLGTTLNRIFTPLIGVNLLYSNGDNMVLVNCTFGNAFDQGNLTTVNLQRRVNDFYWVGTLTSTYNQ